MQSHSSSIKTKQKHPRLPHGLGSAALKGKVYWLTFRNAKGKVVYENSYTADPAEARRIMAQRALPRARAIVEALEKIANGEETNPGKGEAGGRTATRSGRDRGKAAGTSGGRTRREKAPRGEA